MLLRACRHRVLGLPAFVIGCLLGRVLCLPFYLSLSILSFRFYNIYRSTNAHFIVKDHLGVGGCILISAFYMENSLSKPIASSRASDDCTFCRVTGTLFLTGVGIYAFDCARKARHKPMDRYFSIVFGTGALCMAAYRGFGYKRTL